MPRRVGILAYGSLIDDPEIEIENATVETLADGIVTPFKIEFARASETRNGGPTLVPVQRGGAAVSARIFVLNEEISEADAADMLWRRETRSVGTGKIYSSNPDPGPNTVVVERLKNFYGVDTVIYTRIAANIKPLTPERLARYAIGSVLASSAGRDGISYLMAAKRNGVLTPLSDRYEEQINAQLDARDLAHALEKARAGGRMA